MIINLLDVVRVNDNEIKFPVCYESDTIQTDFGEFAVKQTKEFELNIHHLKEHKILIKGETSIEVEIPCDRCLETTTQEISILIDREVDLNEKDSNDHNSENNNYIDGYNLDVDKLLYFEILIGWPMKILCDDACKGICNTCGQNFNLGSCDCEDTSLDPRMTAIRDVFKNFKEV